MKVSGRGRDRDERFNFFLFFFNPLLCCACLFCNVTFCIISVSGTMNVYRIITFKEIGTELLNVKEDEKKSMYES